MNMSFIVSVITPFYKGNKYLSQLFGVVENNCNNLKSAFPQAMVELIIVNDSPQEKVEVPDFSMGFQLKIINHEVNSGIHQARITGLQACSGEYIQFLDQDDVLADNAILSQIRVLASNQADMVICNAYMESSDGSSYLLYKSKTDYSLINKLPFYLKSHNMIKSPGQCLLRKACIPTEWETYVMQKNGADDLFLWILLFEKSRRFAINKEALYIHKYTGENLSDSEAKMSVSSLEIVEFLRQIEYVPKTHAEQLEHSRKFSLEFQECKSSPQKVWLMMKNLNLVSYLAIHKLERILF